MEEIVVSVIIPVYNVKPYIGECLESLLKQSHRKLEIICVDDGSTDGTLEILKEYEKKDNRIRVLMQEHGMAGSARNKGMETAGGEYLLFLDSDDFFHPDLIAHTLAKAVENHADLVIFGADKYDTQNGQIVNTPQYFKKNLIGDRNFFCAENIPNHIFQVSNPAPWTKLFRKSFVMDKKLRFQNLANSNDLYFDMMGMALAERIAWVDEVLTTYRIGMGGNTQSLKKTDPLCFIQAYRKLYDGLKQWGKWEMLEKSFVQLALSGCAYNLNSIHDDAAQYEIWKAMQEPAFTEMGLLEHEKEYYPVPADYEIVAGTAYALKWREKMLAKTREHDFRAISSRSFGREVPLVSVLIPVYNVEKYLGECLDSILSQTMTNLEILCVNDGSTDNSMEVLRTYGERDSRIRIFEQDNAGLSAARNALLTEARGKYIIFLDSDDALEPEALLDLTSIAEENNLDVLYFDAEGFSEEKTDDPELISQLQHFSAYYIRMHDYTEVTDGPELMRRFLQNEEYRTSACMQLIRSDFRRRHEMHFIEGILHEDQAFNFQSMLQAGRVCHVGKQFYRRRVRLDSIMTVRRSFANVYGYYTAYQDMMKRLHSCSLDNDRLMAAREVAARAFKNARDIYLTLSPEERYSWKGLLPVEQLNFELAIAIPAARQTELLFERQKLQRTYGEKSEINTKLQQTYKEKSQINAKLQQTYKEKSEINAKLQQTYKEKSEINAEKKKAEARIAELEKELEKVQRELAKFKEHPMENAAKTILHKIKK